MTRGRSCPTNRGNIQGRPVGELQGKQGKRVGWYSRSCRRRGLVLTSKPRCKANRSPEQHRAPASSVDVRYQAPFAQSPKKSDPGSPRAMAEPPPPFFHSEGLLVTCCLGSLGIWAAKLNQRHNHPCPHTPCCLFTVSRSSGPGKDQ